MLRSAYPAAARALLFGSGATRAAAVACEQRRAYASGSIRDVYIASAARTPIGSFQSSMASLSATELGKIAAAAAVERAGIKPTDVQEIYMGNVIAAGAGQAPARQVALGIGCSETTPACTINKVCASGMKSIMLASQNIALGVQDVMLAGGMESMSNVPYIVRNMRTGAGYGHQQIEDLLLGDGLTDVYNKFHMGMCAENTAEVQSIGREEQDEFALQSYRKSAAASADGTLQKEIVEVSIPQRKGDPKVISEDEEFKNVNEAKVPTLRTVFKKDGTVTAANASTLNDGACATILMSEEALGKHNVKPLAKIIGFGDAAMAPIDFTIAPAQAMPVALRNAGVSVSDISAFEINEAFAVVVLANIKLMGLDPAKVNVHGGAVSLGHPIGMSGARIVAALAHQLQPGQLGCAGICNGGGGASALVIERL